MEKVELVLPAGNEMCLRAAVNNGADAVYLGLDKYNARRFATNFTIDTLPSVIKYCHDRHVKVYVAFNILIKNNELEEYLKLIGAAHELGADAVIIQDPCLVSVIKDNFPNLRVHLSTQATVTNSYSVPKSIDRAVLARELSYEEINNISKEFETEVFVHGSVCVSYSGLCLFSSIVGTRSGNRGQCAQPCRQMYNHKYPLSALDLCLLPKIPELIQAGASAFKVEGRMRSAFYVATVARIYRKAIDSYYAGNFNYNDETISELKSAFGRETTLGFGFEESITNPRAPVNRGIYLGKVLGGSIKVRDKINVGDEVALANGVVKPHKVAEIKENGKDVSSAEKSQIVKLDSIEEGYKVYRLSIHEKPINLGDKIQFVKTKINLPTVKLPFIKMIVNNDSPKLFVKVYNKDDALAVDKAKADVIYYDVLKEDAEEVRGLLRNARFFVYTPWVCSDDDLLEISERIKKINPDGVLVGNRSLMKFIENYEMHLDYSFNIFNDIDIASYKELPIISPELSVDEIIVLKNKMFIVQVHGDIVLMTTKQRISAPELIDEENRHFKVRQQYKLNQLLNSKQLGLFNKAKKYVDNGVKYFYIDTKDEPEKFVRIYRKIITGKEFDDAKIRKGYTTGHYERAVA